MPRKKVIETRVSLTFTGAQRDRIKEIQELVGVATFVDAVRYLVARGQEASTTALVAQRALRHAEESMTPQELFEFAREVKGDSG